MARTSRSNPNDGSRSVISRSEQYQILEKKRLIAATPPRIVTKVVRDKKWATTTNDDVTSPLSTASLATSPAIPQIEWAQMKELLEPTLENNNEDDDSNDDGDGGGMCGGKFNEVAVMAAKSTNDDEDYSNDDGDDGSGGSSKGKDNNCDNDDNGGGGVVRQGKDCTILMTMPFWMIFLMMIMSRSIFRPFRMSRLAIAIVIESWEDPSLLTQMQRKRRRKTTKVNERHLPTPIVASSSLLCPLWT